MRAERHAYGSAPAGAAPGAPRHGRRRRAVCVLLVLLLSAGALGWAATQFVAWRLAYDPALGPPLWEHVYPPWAVLDWARAPWAAQAARTWLWLKLFGGGLFVLVCLGLLSAAQGAQRPIRHEGVHGTARFADRADLLDAGLLPPRPGLPWPGVYVAGWPNADGSLDYLRHNGPEHALCLGPLRSGKAVACVVPTLLSWPDSCVVYDEKGELWDYASGWRKRRAHNVVLRWEPAATGDTVAWNPLDEVRLGQELEYRDAANIVEILADPEGKGLDKHFDPVGAAFLTGLVLHVLYECAARGRDASLADVAHALDDPARAPEALYQAMVDNRHAGGRRHAAIARAGQAMRNREARERTAVHSTAARFVRLFQDPVVARNTARSDFRILDLMNHARPVSLFLVTRGQDKLTMKPLLRLFLTLAMDRLCSVDLPIQRGPADDAPDTPPAGAHRRRLLMLVDEFASLGRLERFQDAMSKCAGYGIKVFLLAQDREQIIEHYGPHESITSHCHVKVLFAPTNFATAQWASDLLGRATVIVQDVSESGQPGFWGRRGYQRTFRAVQRPMLTPDEVMRLALPRKGEDGSSIVAPGEVLVHVGGRYPIRGVQSLFFRDPEFLLRARLGRVASDTLYPRMDGRDDGGRGAAAGVSTASAVKEGV